MRLVSDLYACACSTFMRFVVSLAIAAGRAPREIESLTAVFRYNSVIDRWDCLPY